ncbi:environmental stress-induced protein Ves [Arthrobacter ginsengisoli]|uniref:Environmental stress-induced protein Ves n=1 Tax=Arthrobacter ginsengisoli TaxID=1356565 RepID=A0ABU1UE25_9MICC|nr:HutD family protein [Arthrobacter ginsengisoli]MDR7083457.1 environmental stress-induced protein Ves [Arthrobacter ginsengisoli]
MQIIRYAELKAQPWRNGGGVTRELASQPTAVPAPDGSGQASGWDWRVSIAEISKAGDFSAFPGMDRVLTVVEGELLLLSVDGAERPLEKYRPFRFSGDAAAAGALPTGDIRDLNVITRSGAFKGYTSIIELSKKRAHPVFGGQLGILLQGQATAAPGTAAGTSETAAAAPTTLGRYDAVIGSDTDTPEILGRGFLAVVSIDRVAD